MCTWLQLESSSAWSLLELECEWHPKSALPWGKGLVFCGSCELLAANMQRAEAWQPQQERVWVGYEGVSCTEKMAWGIRHAFSPWLLTVAGPWTGHLIIPCLRLQVCTVKAVISASWDFEGLAKILYKRGCEAKETVQMTVVTWVLRAYRSLAFATKDKNQISGNVETQQCQD